MVSVFDFCPWSYTVEQQQPQLPSLSPSKQSMYCAIFLVRPLQSTCIQCPGLNWQLTWSRAVVFGRGCFSGQSSCFSWKVCTAEDRGRSRLVAPDFSLGSEGVASPSKVCNTAGSKSATQQVKVQQLLVACTLCTIKDGNENRISVKMKPTCVIRVCAWEHSNQTKSREANHRTWSNNSLQRVSSLQHSFSSFSSPFYVLSFCI